MTGYLGFHILVQEKDSIESLCFSQTLDSLET